MEEPFSMEVEDDKPVSGADRKVWRAHDGKVALGVVVTDILSASGD